MNLTITKPNNSDIGLTPELLQSFLRVKNVFCKIEESAYGGYNSCYGFYDFNAITRFGIGTGFYTNNDSAKIDKMNAVVALITKLKVVFEEQDWRVEIQGTYLSDNRSDPKEVGFRIWVYAQ